MERAFRLLAVALFLSDIAILAASSAYTFDTNDNMYAPASLAAGALYRDVHFVQAPLTFYFLKAASFVIPEGFTYLGLRLVSMTMLLATLFVGAFMCLDRWTSRCMFLAFAGANISFISAGLEIGSYSLPLLLLALATASLWRIRDRRIAIGCAALLIGLAASAKLNYVLFFVPLAALALLQRRKEESFADWVRAALLPFAAGGVAGSMPVIVAFAQEPAAFLLHTLTFHTRFSLNTLNMGSFATLKFALNVINDWAAAGGAVFVVLGIYATFIGQSRDERSRPFLLFLMLGIVAALVAAVSPRIVYAQYWGPMTFFAALGGAHFFSFAGARLGLIAVLAVLPVYTVGATGLRSQLSNNLRESSGKPKITTVIEVNQRLKSHALLTKDAHQCDRRIFSLAGAFVVDSGFPLSRYMEGGFFWSWVRDQVPQAYIADKDYHLDEYVLFPERWVRDQRINFLLVGYYPGPAEAGIEKYAIESGFSKEVMPVWNGVTLKFYFNPACIASRT
jgi:hypothetical protein